VSEIIVVDNGSTDGTAEAARRAGARVVEEPCRGYGAACHRGLREVSRPDVVVFLDGDYSDYPDDLPRILDPIIRGDRDMVIGSRLGDGSPVHARAGTRLAVFLLRVLFGCRYTDLGPFRAARYDALLSLGMRDRKFGWTVEMQALAAVHRLRVAEVPVRYRERIGKSKISGTVVGTLRAGYWILSTIARIYLFRGRLTRPR
jgi:glycosyltransferase involved in cell wall biosynthesis